MTTRTSRLSHTTQTESATRPIARFVGAMLSGTALAFAGGSLALAEEAAPTNDAPDADAKADAQAAAANKAKPEESGEVSEVVVRGVVPRFRPDDQTTATGLKMKLIDTPQSITVITTELLDIAGAKSAYEATDLVPGLVRGGQGFGLDRYTLRGNILSNLRINGVSTSIYNSVKALAVERLEVVRGPATALYGVTGSFGGEVNNVLKAPLDQYAATFGAKFGEFDLREGEFDVTGPISDRVSGRLVAGYREWRAPVDVPGLKTNNETTALGSLKFDFTDSTSSTIWAYYNTVDRDPQDGGFLQWTADGHLQMPDIAPGRWYFTDPRQSTEKTDRFFLMADLKHSFENGWDFKTQAAWNKFDHTISYFFPFGPAGYYSLGDDDVYLYTYDLHRDSNDFTFDVSLGGAFQAFGREHRFYAALEYEDPIEPRERLLKKSIYTGVMNMQQGGLGVLNDGTHYGLIDRDDALLVPTKVRDFATDTSYRASFQVLLNPIDRFELLLGALYEDSKTTSRTPIFNYVILDPPTKQVTKVSEVVGRAGITYDMTDGYGMVSDSRLYFSYSEGFNPNGAVFDKDGKLLDDPQRMRQYEVGIKTEYLGGAVSTALDYFDSEVTNLPIRADFLGSFGSNVSVLEGLRTVKGLEAELMGEVLPGWNVAFNYALQKTKISDANYDFTAPVQSVPKNSAALYSSYQFQVGPLTGFRFGGAAVYKSDYGFVGSLPNVKKFGQFMDGEHTRIDVFASYDFHNSLDGLQIAVNAHNVTGENIYVAKENHPGFSVTQEDVSNISATVRYQFK